MSGTWGTNRGEEKFVQDTGGETLEKDFGGVGRLISKLVWKKMNKMAGTIYMKLEAGTSGRLTWTRQYTFGHYRMQGMYCGGIRVAGWSLQHGYHSNPTTPTFQHTSNQEHTTNVVIQQNSRKLLMIEILMYETCWAHKKWNKIASDIKLVFNSSTVKPRFKVKV